MFHILLRILKNRYFIVTVAFIVWLVFFDNNNLLSRGRTKQTLNELRQQKSYYLHEIAKNKQEILELKTDTANLEKFAREKYLMKKDGEEVFVIGDE
jgi:cell division protein FtsB